MTPLSLERFSCTGCIKTVMSLHFEPRFDGIDVIVHSI